MISWPHFDLSAILTSIGGAVIGWFTALWNANRKK